MEKGFFLGLFLVFVYMAIAMEYYFLVFDKYTEEEMNRIQFFILSAVTVAAFILHSLNMRHMRTSFLPILLIPAAYAIVSMVSRFTEKGIESAQTRKDIRHYLDAIKRRPDIPVSYIMLGDIYFKNDENEKALYYYRKAYDIEATPESLQKIKLASKQVRIEKGEVWICRECRKDNPAGSDRCKECGTSRKVVLALKEDVGKNREDIRKWIVKGFALPFAAIFTLVMLKSVLSPFIFTILSFFLAVLFVYIVLKKLFTW